MAASDHLNQRQFGTVSVAKLLRMQSVDAPADAESGTVRSVLAQKRSHPQYQGILQSMAEHGQQEPIELRTDPWGGTMMGDGHHRVAAAHELGWKSLRYYRVD